VDTGALYRTVGLKFSKMGADTKLDCDISSVLADTTVDIRFVNGEQRVFLDGEDVSEEIRTPVASMMASAVSAKGEVRAFLLEMQRKLARENDVLMDGRDIGTVVLPNATVKIFLTASAEERARRRYDELISKGMTVTFKEVYDDMVQRDYNDSHREIAPLKQADDAVLADTTGLSPEESLQLILNIVKERI
ncbi:MAG: (d)CMP kinase, partial [Clostridia bacterium]|nr:(d)CMP kinase [Clostridia bacterium]